MRQDMGKVLVERPRLGRWRGASRPGKGYARRLKKCLDSGDSPPSREGMKRRYPDTKCFNEHLSPLRRFLDANVGRPWDKVYSEICRHVNRGNVVQKHIITHLFDYVVTSVILIDGQPCCGSSHARRYGEPLRTSHRSHQWYVCPRSGILRKSKHVLRKKLRIQPPRRITLNKSQICLLLNGQWELVTVAPIPRDHSQSRAFDVILRRNVYSYAHDAHAWYLYESHVYATARRPLSRRELLALPIPIEWLK